MFRVYDVSLSNTHQRTVSGETLQSPAFSVNSRRRRNSYSRRRRFSYEFNPLNVELNSIRHLVALVGNRIKSHPPFASIGRSSN